MTERKLILLLLCGCSLPAQPAFQFFSSAPLHWVQLLTGWFLCTRAHCLLVSFYSKSYSCLLWLLGEVKWDFFATWNSLVINDLRRTHVIYKTHDQICRYAFLLYFGALDSSTLKHISLLLWVITVFCLDVIYNQCWNTTIPCNICLKSSSSFVLLLFFLKSLLTLLLISAREFLAFSSIKCLLQHAFGYSLDKGPSKILLL